MLHQCFNMTTKKQASPKLTLCIVMLGYFNFTNFKFLFAVTKNLNLSSSL